MADRRTTRTKKAIRNAFLTLLKDKRLNRITIAEISRLADLGRGTFYLHYRDIYALYEEIEDELYSGLEEIFDQSYSTTNPSDLFTLTETISQYLSDNRKIFILLMHPEDKGKILHKLRRLFTNKTLIEAKKTSSQPGGVWKADAVWTVFAVSGVIGVLEEWLFGRVEITQKELSSVLHQILVKLNF